MSILHKTGKSKKELCDQCRTPKNKINICFLIISFIALNTFVFPKTSHAYLDPGTGSFVFQMVIAGVVGGLFTIKTFWRNIISLFKKDKKE